MDELVDPTPVQGLLVLRERGPRRRIRGLACRMFGHRWKNQGVFFRIRERPDGEWQTMQARKGVNVCARCLAHEQVELNPRRREFDLDAVWVLGT